MRILAIETATMLGGIALLDDSAGLIAEIRLNVKSTHSERLMTGAEHILKQSGLTITDIDCFALSIGPGSFTGLRIGLSTVKGLSYATGKPVVSVPTLEALAYNFPYCTYPVCTMLDARKKEVYAALFRWKREGFIRLLAEVPVTVPELMEHIRHFTDKKVIFTGEGALLYRDRIIEFIGKKAIFASPDMIVPSPAHIALLGMKKAHDKEFSELMSLVPLYIRRSEAELKKDGSNKDSKNAAT
jgi:tRNA threonylcarbamoyladenosine biosynthesis protein TsaB